MSCPYTKLMEPCFYANGVPLKSMVDLAGKESLVWVQDPKRPYWAVFSRENIDFISKRADLFSSEVESAMPDEHNESELAVIQKQLINMDPPKHHKYRSMITKHFSKESLNEQEVFINKTVEELFSNFIKKPEGDFIKEIAMPIPYYTIFKILGFSEEHYPTISSLINEILFGDQSNASSELFLYVINCLNEMENMPSSTIINTLKNQVIDGHRLSLEDLVSYINFLLIAGTSSTQATIGHAMRLLIEYPQQYSFLCENPSLIPDAVEEILRFSTAFICMRRTAMYDLKLGSAKINAGDKVVMFYGIANHNKLKNSADTLDFDLTRLNIQRAKRIKHRTFGVGQHFCLGHQLAKIELNSILKQMIKCIRKPVFLESPEYFMSNHLTSIKTMNIAFDVV